MTKTDAITLDHIRTIRTYLNKLKDDIKLEKHIVVMNFDIERCHETLTKIEDNINGYIMEQHKNYNAKDDTVDEYFECSKCRRRTILDKATYCPNCGVAITRYTYMTK